MEFIVFLTSGPTDHVREMGLVAWKTNFYPKVCRKNLSNGIRIRSRPIV